MAGTSIPENPTVRDVIELVERSYWPAGVLCALKGRKRTLNGRRPIDLLDTVEGRREAYCWALALAEGTFT